MLTEKLFLQADHYQQIGEHKKAATLYLDVLKLQPEHPESNHNLALIEAHTKSINDALPRFKTAVIMKPETEQFWISYIDALVKAGKTESAIQAIEEGQKHGLGADTARRIVTRFLQDMEEAAVQSNYNENDNSDSICTITTIVPAYKVHYLEDLLLSLTSQTYKNFKVIISDDSPENCVTKRINELHDMKLTEGISLTVVEGPKSGAMSNIVHLLNAWNGDTPFLHILLDDDVIYPLFYQRHLAAHQEMNLSTSVSFRWISDENGFPINNAKIPKFIDNSQVSHVHLEAPDLFNSTIPYCSNWLGEFSNCLFSREIALQLKDPTMAGIAYYGLCDIGLILQGSLQGKTTVIKEHLGAFRTNQFQNTNNHKSTSFQCGYLAWIALALSAYNLEQINQEQARRCIRSTSELLLEKYPDNTSLLEIATLTEKHNYPDKGYQSIFLVLWNELLAQQNSLFKERPDFV